VNCQRLEICLNFNGFERVRIVLEGVILSTQVGFSAEFDRAARALDQEKALSRSQACGAFWLEDAFAIKN